MEPSITVNQGEGKNYPTVSVWNERGHTRMWNCRTLTRAKKLAQALHAGRLEDGTYRGYPVTMIG